MDKHLMEHHQKDEKELVLDKLNYAYALDKNKGTVKAFTGPTTYTMTPNDVPVVLKNNQFVECRLNEAIQLIPIAVEGFYMVVLNPSPDGKQPEAGTQLASPDLDIGRRINIPGPVTFRPWPGQMFQIIRGHHLRSNEYLRIKIYNEEEARKNWGTAVIKPATGEDSDPSSVISSDVPEDLAVGKHYNIKGTEVSFYIPPTGVTVVPDDVTKAHNDPRRYVRNALTLEVLEYAILIDENGNKRYERGPNVVFPKPTELLFEEKKEGEKKGRVKFRAIELNEIQGLHIKVIAPYTDSLSKIPHEEGEELFITGKDTAIYYPRMEHSIVRYDGKSKHFATAIPVGEGRYVMDRITGEIVTNKGPMMLLPDPRNQVIVRRILTPKQCRLWYPGNDEVLQYNSQLAGIAQNVPTTRSGTVSDGDYERSTRAKRKKKGMDASLQHSDQRAMMADEFSRSSTYTQPRTVTFDNKFSGVPRVDVWTGYAVMVVSPSGKRHVEIGPSSLLLGYEETLEALSLSTGNPKTSHRLLETAFLRVKNNNISDHINDTETSDHVKSSINVKYKVDFEGDEHRWWDIENYVKHITDHVRSVVKGAIKKIDIEEFYSNPVDILRDIILGKSDESKCRPGMVFENGARIKDVEIMGVQIQDERIQNLLDVAQHEVVKNNIELAREKRSLETIRSTEEINQQKLQAKTDTVIFKNKLDSAVKDILHKIKVDDIQRRKEESAKDKELNMANIEAQVQITSKEIENNNLVHAAKVSHEKDFQAIEIDRLNSQTEAAVKQATCVQPELAHSMNMFRETLLIESLAKGFGNLAVIEGKGIVKTAKDFFDMLPQNLRAHLDVPNGDKRRLTE